MATRKKTVRVVTEVKHSFSGGHQTFKLGVKDVKEIGYNEDKGFLDIYGKDNKVKRIFNPIEICFTEK